MIDSPRAGGRYVVTGSIETAVMASSVPEKRAITRWLIRQRSQGVSVPRLDSTSLGSAVLQPALKFTEKVNAILSLFGQNIDRMDRVFQVSRTETPSASVPEMIAASDTVDVDDLRACLTILKNMGLLIEAGSTINTERYALTSAGWERIETLESKIVSTSQAFVAMWFSPLMSDVFQQGFVPAITAAGYNPLRIDKKEHINKVDDEIIAEIRRSRFLVSDLTCEPEKPRGGVYFEAGFAMGIGIPVIWTCKSTSIGDLHFDTRQYNHIVWETPNDLHAQLYARIGAVIGDGPIATKAS
jgi:hypothetical protein